MQIYADRARRGRSPVLGIIGERVGHEGGETRELRRQLADDLRARLREVDPTLPFSQNATVLRCTVAMPLVTDIDADTAENVWPQRAEIVELVERFAALEPALSSWCVVALPSKLTRTAQG